MSAPWATGADVDIGEPELVVRPVRIRWAAVTVAIGVFVLFAVGAALADVAPAGFVLRPADQVATVVFGALAAGGILLLARPRLRAGPGGVEVRAAILTRTVPWDAVLAVSFPDGAQFARLELPDDEYLAVSALQAVDRSHAAVGVRRLRELHARYVPGSPHARA